MLREKRRHANFKPNRKLDRKSSRGMIYENEELRLRTININAELEQGQSDLKKLRRENFQLKREIWSLRDEYERLDAFLRKKNCSDIDDFDAIESYCANEDINCNDTFDSSILSCCNCQNSEDNICYKSFDENTMTDKSVNLTPACCAKMNYPKSEKDDAIKVASLGAKSELTRADNSDKHFDILSVVSEECLSNTSEGQPNNNNNNNNNNNDNNNIDDETNDGIDRYAIDLSSEFNTDFQTMVPTLKHFEDLSYKDIGPNVGSSGELHYKTGSTVSLRESNGSTDNDEEKEHNKSKDEKENSSKRKTKLNLNQPPQFSRFFSLLRSGRNKPKSPKDSLQPDLYIKNVLASSDRKVYSARQDYQTNISYMVRSTNNQNTKVEQTNRDEQKEENLQDDANTEQIVHEDINSSSDSLKALVQGIQDVQFHTNKIYKSSIEFKEGKVHQRNYEEITPTVNIEEIETKSMENSSNGESDSPLPSIPVPMALLPPSLSYVNLVRSDTKNSINSDSLLNNAAKKVVISEIYDDTVGRSLSTVFPSNKDDNTSGKCVEPKAREESGGITNTGPTILTTNFEIDRERKNSNSSLFDKEKAESISNDLLKDSHEVHASSSQLNEDNVSIENEVRPTWTIKTNESDKGARVFNVISRDSEVIDEQPSFMSSAPIYERCKKLPSSRRHSDGLILNSNQRHQYYQEMFCKLHRPSNQQHSSGHLSHNRHYSHKGSGPPPHHHHHHNHHSQYSNMNRLESNTPMSERHGSSLISSRESSLSLNIRSTPQQKRKLSITSHTYSTKIPWCACWGNGCF